MKGNIVYKYIKRGLISVSNEHYKTLQFYKGTSRKMSKSASTYSDSETSIESSYMNNGMRLVCDYRNTSTTTIGCFIPNGAMCENPEERGSSLFLEHLLFKRTKCNSQEQLESLLEEIGAKVEVVALRDMFLFYGIVVTCKVEKLVQLFADVILNGATCDKDVETEKCLILHQLSRMSSDREKIVMDYLPSVAYEGTALANSVYPETRVIKKFRTQSLIEFRKRILQTCFITMVSTGCISLCELQKIVGKHFSCCVNTNKVQSDKETLEFRFSGVELRIRDDDHELGYVAIGVEGPSYKQREDHLALTVAKEIVGSWDRTYGGLNHNAPYIAHFAYNTDLCELYKSFFHNFAKSTSIWGCYFASDKLCLEFMINLLQSEWLKLCTSITEKEVSRAINQCITKELQVSNDPINHFLNIVESIYRYDCYEPLEERIIQYEKITPAKIRKVSETYIYDQNPVVVALGRIENLTDYALIRDGMYSLKY
ncbi:Cytochrome b-c1 complex subunit 1, mitochondrial [Anthophora retusa]